MNIKGYKDIDKITWDKFVIKSREGWLYQTTTWIDLVISLGTKSYSFGVFSDEGELLAICPIYKYGKKFYTGLSGPVISHKIGFKGGKRIWKYMFDYIDRLALKMNIILLDVRITKLSEFYLKNEQNSLNPLWNVGIYNYINSTPTLQLVLDLSKDDEILFSELDTDCRNLIRKSIKSGVQCYNSDTYDSMRKYYEIHVESWERTGLEPNSLQEVEMTYNTLIKNNNIKFFFANYNDIEVAAVCIHIYKDAVFYAGGCSKEEYLKLRANNYLLWSAIKWAKENGYQWFEIGEFPVYPGNNLKEYTVGQYKAQFGKHYGIAYEGRKVYRTIPYYLMKFKQKLHNIFRRIS